MRLDTRDMARLWDMLDAARSAVGFVEGMSSGDFCSDRKTRQAVERNLEIIGEAARCVSPGVHEAFPEIPWRSMTALRNVLAHEYGDIRFEIIWSITTNKLPLLIRQLVGIGVDTPPPEEGV